jgi:hypothetical protein
VSEITVEPIIVWAAFGAFVLGVLVGTLVVLDEVKRAMCRHFYCQIAREVHESSSRPRRWSQVALAARVNLKASAI